MDERISGDDDLSRDVASDDENSIHLPTRSLRPTPSKRKHGHEATPRGAATADETRGAVAAGGRAGGVESGFFLGHGSHGTSTVGALRRAGTTTVAFRDAAGWLREHGGPKMERHAALLLAASEGHENELLPASSSVPSAGSLHEVLEIRHECEENARAHATLQQVDHADGVRRSWQRDVFLRAAFRSTWQVRPEGVRLAAGGEPFCLSGAHYQAFLRERSRLIAAREGILVEEGVARALREGIEPLHLVQQM